MCSFIGQSVISCRMEGEGGNGGKRRENDEGDGRGALSVHLGQVSDVVG